MGEDRTGRPSRDLDRLTVAEAAHALSISQDAVRKRISRGTIPHEKDEAGRVYVYPTPSETGHKTDQDTAQDTASKTVQDAYVRSLEDQIAFLRRELERKDTILLNLTDRIPQLEAPSESPADERESPESSGPTSRSGEEVREELDTERARREMAESMLHEGMDEERWRREEAERERDDLRRELFALRRQRESPETAEEEPERAEPRPTAAGPQTSPERPHRGPITLRGLRRRLFGR